MGKHFLIRWDRHGGDWISLRPIKIEEPNHRSIFGLQNLEGLSKHVYSDDGCTKLYLTRDLIQLSRLFSDWAKVFIKIPTSKIIGNKKKILKKQTKKKILNRKGKNAK